ncbi:hypothetical protein AB0J21_14235 [Streptomyces sp. NPDC049954]|uniref:hypothetical protein n=1 Tax=Streptomyces sp. NPDC049954 TaxID=3155779 RepID=UPI00343091CA
MSQEPTRSSRISRRGLLAGTTAAAAGAVVLGPGSPAASAAAPTEKGRPVLPSGERLVGRPARARKAAHGRRQRTRFGIGYETWFGGVIDFESTEAEPLLGRYDSEDPEVIRQHARWIRWAGYDFVLVDWSNNLGGNWDNGVAEKIMKGTDALLDVYADLDDRPEVVLLLGLDNGATDTANWDAQIERVKTRYLESPRLRPLFMEYDGKPLLTVYTGARWTEPPAWRDPAFTVRWTGAYREVVLNPGGQWSWVDRSPYANGQSEPVGDFADGGLRDWHADPAWKLAKMSVNAAYPGVPEITFASTRPAEGAEQKTGTLTSAPFTLTREVLSFNAIGTDPPAHRSAKVPGADSRNLYLLKDAATGEVLRWHEPPGTDTYFMVRQWNVADLKGREVVFEAVSNRTEGPPVGWIGFFGLQQQRAEIVTAAAAQPGNEYYGAFGNWDAQPRMSGATLLRQAQGIYDFEPELALVQQWNEFGAPDQFSVAGSNDIEPTKVTTLKGAESDGWGFYYLSLAREVIDQYRAGEAAPRVLLDTRYP